MHAAIEVRELTKTYSQGAAASRALDSVDLDARAGEVMLLMGPSGSGKTTLVSIMGCILRPSSGSVKIRGREVAHLRERELPAVRLNHIGFVFQGFNLLARTTALENTEMPMLYNRHRTPTHEQRKHALRALELVGLADRADHKPNQLSGGQQQRVAIARALVNQPSLILADEPTGNLDSQTSIEIMGVFQKLNGQGITIIMVTHELDIARYTKRMVVLRDGKISRTKTSVTG